MTRLSQRSKYNTKRVWSDLCGRQFDSKAERRRGEELCLLQKAGEIMGLRYQEKFVLSESPKISITIDFSYWDEQRKKVIYEDVKGVLTREFRVKMAWLKEKHGIEVELSV